MASPLVLINGNPQANGFNASSGATVTIALASNTGVFTWNVVCIGTDELNTIANISSTLVVNHANNTATFTAPSGSGSAVIFKSIINNGVDINGVAQSTYTTTFAVYVLSNGYRVAAQNEVLEGDSTYGWVSKFNPIARNFSSGGGGGTGPQGPQGSPGATGPAGSPGSAGATGARGATGSQGPQGNVGSTGSVGPQGIQGPTGSIGPAGSQGNQGSPGVTGTQGQQGVQGATGSIGSTGPAGSQGTQGSPGIQGSTGSVGPQGNQGPTGSIGPQGNQGIQGTTGSQGIPGSTGSIGFTGSVGPAGPTGSIGGQGIQGNQGSPGITGATGPQGAQGIQGPTGPLGGGAQGPQGSPGPMGATGIQGPQGNQGATGSQGNAGPTGSIGPQGIAGATGPTGPQGNAGAQGPTGTIGSTGSIGPQGNAGATGSIGSTGPQGIPGPTGSIGSTGSIGPQGNQGIQGSPGVTGAIGPQGVTGPAGSGGGGGGSGNVFNPLATGLNANNLDIYNLKTLDFNSEISNGNSGSSFTVNWTSGSRQTLTINAATATLSFTAPIGVSSLLLRVVQDATGGRLVIWPSTVQWVSGAPPVLSTGANAVDIISLYWNGTNYYSTYGLSFLATGGAGPGVGPTGPTGGIGPQGIQGATGPQGFNGANGASPIWILNNGATLSAFNTLNLQAGLIGTQGAGNIVSIGPNFVQQQALPQASGFAVLWNGNSINLGNMGATTVGATSPAYVSINSAGYYQINTTVAFTGVPSGAHPIIMQQFLGATGTTLGNGTPIAQSVIVNDRFLASGSVPYGVIQNSYIANIPSGTNISTWLYGDRAGVTGVPISATGTVFSIKQVG